MYSPLGSNVDTTIDVTLSRNNTEAAVEDAVMPTKTSLDVDGHQTRDGNTLIAGHVKFIDALGIVCGIIIGSGIFSSPGVALVRAGSPAMSLIAWFASGCLVILTATCYFELAGMLPHAGGDFHYINRAYGERTAFAFAWFNFWISKTGSQSIIATIFGRYLERAIIICSGGNNAAINSAAMVSSINNGQGESVLSKIAAICLIVFITSINCFAVQESKILQNTLTALKLALVLALFVAAILFSSDSTNESQPNLSLNHSFDGSNGMVGFCTALVACLWSFDGWADLSFMTEELMDPHQLPKIVTMAVVVVTSAYLLCNIAYLLVMPIDKIKDSRAIGTAFGTTIDHGNEFGFWTLFISLGVSFSTLGAINGSIMTGGRAFYAVARDGKAPRQMSVVNRLGSPYGALVAQGMWSLVLISLPGSNFNSLLDYCIPISWIFYALTSCSVIVLRYREPDTYRPFRTPFYPMPPIIVFVLAICISTSSLIQSPGFCLLAIGFVLISVPVHIYCFESDKTTPKQEQANIESAFLNTTTCKCRSCT